MADTHVLVAELEALSRHLEPPDPEVDVASRAIARIRSEQRTRRTRRYAVLAAAAVLVTALVLSVPATRHAVAELFGFGGARITRTRALPDEIGTRLDLGRPVSTSEARREGPGAVSFPSQVGAPNAAFAGRPPGGVTFVWAPASGLPAVPSQDDVGALLTVFRGNVDRTLIEKLVPEGTHIESVDVDGVPGYWLGGGAHAFLYIDEDGEQQRETMRLAGPTLLWVRDGVTYRLEAALERDAMTRLAEGFSAG